MTIDASNRMAQALVSPLAPRQPRDISIAGPSRPDARVSGLPAPASRPGVTSDVRSLARDMAASPPVNGGKVAAVRAAIKSGGYKVQPEKLADAMISLSLPSDG